MKKIGLTGGIGVGKSFVADILRKKGYHVYDCDSRAKYLMANSESLRRDLVSILGPGCIKDGELDRRYIASCIFGNKQLLAKINAVIHPAVKDDFINWVNDLKDCNDVLFMESAILFESGFDKLLDEVWCVNASYDTRLKRAMARDNIPKELVEERIHAQMSQEDKIRKCSAVIDNDVDSDVVSALDLLLERC